MFRRIFTFLDESLVLRILERLGHVGILVALLLFWLEVNDRKEERLVRAWSVISDDRAGFTGKSYALETIHSYDEPFNGMILTAGQGKVEISRVDVSNGLFSHPARFYHTTFSDVVATFSDFSDASFWRSDLRGTNFNRSNLSQVEFWEVDLSQAWLNRTILFGADFRGANLEGTLFFGANVSNAIFCKPERVSENETWTIDLNQCASGLTEESLNNAWAWSDSHPVGLEDAHRTYMVCDADQLWFWEGRNKWRVPEGC